MTHDAWRFAVTFFVVLAVLYGVAWLLGIHP